MTLRAVLLLPFLTVPVAAQVNVEKPLKEGDAVPSTFRAFVAADARFEKGNPRNRVSKMHDFITDNGLNPTLAVFSRTAPAAKTAAAEVAVEVKRLIDKFKADRLGAFVTFITLDKEYQLEDNRDAKAAAAAALSVQLDCGPVPFALAEKASAATKAWGLDEKDDLTVVFYDRMTVKKVWRFTAGKPPTPEQIKAIGAAVEADLKPKR